ncbi:MAG: hypothetical protein HQM13_20945 [SAR324 cluster bacterium]|nr:hypothetical protein [SAR324 cluster bacterium]
MDKNEPHRKRPTPHEAIILSQSIVDKHQIRITFLDGDVMIEQVRWHTPEYIGLRDGKVVNKRAIKYWEIIE